jgi:hypothetical protein
MPQMMMTYVMPNANAFQAPQQPHTMPRNPTRKSEYQYIVEFSVDTFFELKVDNKKNFFFNPNLAIFFTIRLVVIFLRKFRKNKSYCYKKKKNCC